MSDFMGGLFGVALILYLASCALVVPAIFVGGYLEKRDCELINQVDCHWQMLPIKQSQN